MKKISNQQAVLLDLDGTLLNTNNLIVESFQHTYKILLGQEKPVAEILKTFGEPLWLTMEREFPKDSERAIHLYREFQKETFEDLITIFPGMEELILELKSRGVKVAVVTSRLKNTAMQGLRKFDLIKYFDFILTIDDIKNHKPDPESIEVTLGKLGVERENAWMVGDSEYDILCAKNAGVKSILVDWSVMEQEKRKVLAPDSIVTSAEEILMLIEGDGKF